MRVLVGLEDTGGAKVALRWAAQFAHLTDGSLVVAQSWQYPSVPLFAERDRLVAAEEVDRSVETALRDLVAATLDDELRSQVDISVRACRGPAAHALRTAAERLAIDLIVVGARSDASFDRRLLGSVSRSIAEDAPCPVAVVPADLGDTDGPIVVGVDGSTDARAAVTWAGQAASRSGSDVVLVHGFGPYGAELPPDALADDAVEGEHLVAEYRDTLDALSVSHRSVVRVSDARSLLEQVGEQEHARMVVVGARGTGKLATMLLGSVSGYLVLNLRRPTVVVHPR